MYILPQEVKSIAKSKKLDELTSDEINCILFAFEQKYDVYFERVDKRHIYSVADLYFSLDQIVALLLSEYTFEQISEVYRKKLDEFWKSQSMKEALESQT